MNHARARRIWKRLQGKKVGRWTVVDYINHGKSAVVLKGSSNGEEVALKLFDEDMVELYGRKIQLRRVEREKSLIGQQHPNLIQIKDGGECPHTSYLFVAMAYLPEKNLSEKLGSIPPKSIFPLISQVASAAKFLEDHNLVHRDIKPSNIAISKDLNRVTLLDLGVVRPLKLSELTDRDDEKFFIGTLQYSPPELLYRKEEHSIEGWRAVTFYQLGAVLHDMIMRQRLFQDWCHPFAQLVDAVRQEKPEIQADDVDSDLVLLAQCCLLKNPGERLSLVDWNSFFEPPSKATMDDVRQRIKRQQAILITRCPVNHSTDRADEEARRYKLDLQLRGMCDAVCNIMREIRLSNMDIFPPIEVSPSPETEETVRLIGLCCGPSQGQALYTCVALYVSIALTDPQDDLVELDYVALCSGSPVNTKQSQAFERYSLYRGPFNTEIIRKKIEQAMFSLVNKALEHQISCGISGAAESRATELPPTQLALDLS